MHTIKTLFKVTATYWSSENLSHVHMHETQSYVLDVSAAICGQTDNRALLLPPINQTLRYRYETTRWLKSHGRCASVLCASSLRHRSRAHQWELEITWINCKMRTGWPILRRSCRTEECRRRKKGNISCSARGFSSERPNVLSLLRLRQRMIDAGLFDFRKLLRKASFYLKAVRSPNTLWWNCISL